MEFWSYNVLNYNTVASTLFKETTPYVPIGKILVLQHIDVRVQAYTDATNLLYNFSVGLVDRADPSKIGFHFRRYVKNGVTGAPLEMEYNMNTSGFIVPEDTAIQVDANFAGSFANNQLLFNVCGLMIDNPGDKLLVRKNFARKDSLGL